MLKMPPINWEANKFNDMAGVWVTTVGSYRKIPVANVPSELLIFWG